MGNNLTVINVISSIRYWKMNVILHTVVYGKDYQYIWEERNVGKSLVLLLESVGPSIGDEKGFII